MKFNLNKPSPSIEARKGTWDEQNTHKKYIKKMRWNTNEYVKNIGIEQAKCQKKKKFIWDFIEMRNGYCVWEYYLASERTESKWIEKTSATNLAGIGDTLSRPWLWPLIQENDFSAVDNVSLDARDVQKFLYFRYSYHVVVGRSSYLKTIIRDLKKKKKKGKEGFVIEGLKDTETERL